MRLVHTPWLVALALLGGSARAWAGSDVAKASAVAPWSPVQAWYLSPSDRSQGPWRARVTLAIGPSSNTLHLSATEKQRFSLAAQGEYLAVPQPSWPIDGIAGVWLAPSVSAAWFGDLAGAAMTVSLAWDGQFALRARAVNDEPLSLAVGRVLREGSHPVRSDQAGAGEIWVSLRGLADPYHYQRPLPVHDAALENPLPDHYENAIRHERGGEVTGGWAITGTLLASPYLRMQRATYRRDLENWDATAWDTGARVRWRPIDLLVVQAHGGFASEVARGDLVTTSKKEVDPSWAGTRWGVGVGLDTTGRRTDPFRVMLSGEVLQRNFRTGDANDLAHFGRRDVGGSATATGSYAFAGEVLPRTKMALGLSYTFAYNHTNLPLVIHPPDESDFTDHTVMLQIHLSHFLPGHATAE